LVRRLTPLVLGAGVLGGGAYFVARSLRADARHGDPRVLATTVSAEPSASTVLADPSGSPTASSRVASAGGPSVSAAPSATSAPVRTLASPSVSPKAGVERRISFRSIHPPFGVKMTIDGSPAPDPDPRKSFTLDDKMHTLVFTCAGDLCTPMTVKIDPGSQDVSLPV